MREEVVTLEHHAHAGADGIGILLAQCQIGIFQPNRTVLNFFEQIGATQQCALATTGCPDKTGDGVLGNIQIHIPQHQVLSIGLVHGLVTQQIGHATPPICMRAAERLNNQSVNRANGIVIAMNSSAATT